MSQLGIQNFNKTAPWVMALLMQDFGFDLDDAAAVVGNGGHESDGLRAINEAKPVVAGSRGGFGWFQWTGPRRVAFEQYCARNGMSPLSDKANYNWLWVELNGAESKAIERTKAAGTLDAKVKAFEMAYERAGIKHYPGRVEWAKRALMAWEGASTDDKTPPWQRGRAPEPVVAQKPAHHTPITLPLPDGPYTTAERPQMGDDGVIRTPDGREPARIILDALGNVIKTVPKEIQGKSPIEKVIGAGKGAILGGGGGLTFGAALVYLADIAGYVPEGTDSALLGLAVGTVFSTIATGVGAMIGAYQAKRNAD